MWKWVAISQQPVSHWHYISSLTAEDISNLILIVEWKVRKKTDKQTDRCKKWSFFVTHGAQTDLLEEVIIFRHSCILKSKVKTWPTFFYKLMYFRYIRQTWSVRAHCALRSIYKISIDHNHLQVSRTVEDFDEEEVTKAFQGECQTLGELWVGVVRVVLRSVVEIFSYFCLWLAHQCLLFCQNLFSF